MAEPKILRINESFRISPTGDTTKVRVVQFNVGNHGPFSYEVPEADFDVGRVQAELERQAADITKLTGE